MKILTLHVALQGHSQDFSRGMHNFSNLPPTPTPSLTGRSTHMDIVMLYFVYCEDRPGWNNLFMFYTIPLAVCVHLQVYHSRFKQKLTFWCGGKESFVLKTDFRVSKKKQTVRCFTKNTPKNQIELNGIQAIYCRCCFNFYTFFFNYSLFLFYFISFNFFYPWLFQVCTCVSCIQVAMPLLHQVMYYF